MFKMKKCYLVIIISINLYTSSIEYWLISSNIKASFVIILPISGAIDLLIWYLVYLFPFRMTYCKEVFCVNKDERRLRPLFVNEFLSRDNIFKVVFCFKEEDKVKVVM